MPTLDHRLHQHARSWRVAIDRVTETPTSLIAYGHRDGASVVLKLVRASGDEWNAGLVVRAFGGRGMVRALEVAPGAVLLERLRPGHSLVPTVIAGDDDAATTVLADVIAVMSPDDSASTVPTAADWGRAFNRYATLGQNLLPPELVAAAEAAYSRLLPALRRPRLLHGDLQHSNVLFDAARGWLAIDPKGVVAELEFEVGAALRNPRERTDLFVQPATIERRLRRFATVLDIDVERALAWAFAQAVLSAIWTIEDGDPLEEAQPALRLASAMQGMLNVSS